METITEYSCGNCGHKFANEEEWSGNCDEHSCSHCECDCSDCASEEDIAFSCENCGTDIVRHSREHDDSWCNDADEWFCGECKHEAMEAEEEEKCKYCDGWKESCPCVCCYGCGENITELVDDCAEQGEGDWAHPCLTCGEKCGRLYSFSLDEDNETFEFLKTKGWKRDDVYQHQLVRSN